LEGELESNLMMRLEVSPMEFGRGTVRVCRRAKSILLVALSRPERFNAFNDDGKELTDRIRQQSCWSTLHRITISRHSILDAFLFFLVYEDLIAVMSFVEQDPTLSAIVLTGSGPYFSSGADLSAGAFTPERNGRRTRYKPAGRFMLSIIRFSKIFAAAVNGPSVGIAVTLLMHCDLVHCSDQATCWAPFTRLALVPELCSSQTFIESHGLSKANELLLLGKKIDARTALDWNICSKVVSISAEGTADPFSSESLASRMCIEIDKKLLSLPLGDRTAEYFVSFIKGGRRDRMEQLCLAELNKLDERFDTGQVQEAARHIKIGSRKETKDPPRSKL
jgi:Delta3-Delta2-enoyl-CoA isomerase